MFKVLIFAKRRPGLSMQEFIDYYESTHAPRAASKISNLRKYIRRYLARHGAAQGTAELEFDVLSELWFDDRQGFERGMAALAIPETAALMAADQKHLFDPASIRFATTDERETPGPSM